MKISREWLQTFFDASLPDVPTLAEALTFHAFEIESVEGDVLDVKVTPNRGHDCLSHRGIAKELSAILKIPIRDDGFTKPVMLEPKTGAVTVSIEEPQLCRRYVAGYVRGVKVGPSPEWLVKRLAFVGQQSINNVVDATNFVMFNIGQPLHAFDAKKLGSLHIGVRRAKEGETMQALDERTYMLAPSMLVITADGRPVGIAGVKGGLADGIDEKTTDIVLESANFDGVSVRKTAAALKLRTDASNRFQQVISPELAAYGMRQAIDLIGSIAGGEAVGFVDEYPLPQKPWTVPVSTELVNGVLGTTLSKGEVAEAFKRLGFSFEQRDEDFIVSIPYERLDLTIPEDLVEEVGRIVGYDKVPPTELPAFPKEQEVNANFFAAEKVREEMMAKGYSEVYTSVFAEKGERSVANKVGGEKPYLRTTLVEGLRDAYERNMRNRDLLGLKKVRIFEIGIVWYGGKELMMVATADGNGVREAPPDTLEASPPGYPGLPVSTVERYESFSKYPFIVRDISMWIPQGPEAISEVLALFGEGGQGLLRHVELFDQYKKGERISYAFRLVLQSFEKTLTDEEANAVMERIYAALKVRGWEVR
ncbi:phenylalanine--tRNA ligase subunit beta [Candidatus Kaiserbacteria bacterium]|nr:phenylalanine--tRNA ligase subunit beta [Candidatus Kaiserbacteria bacterium]